MAGKKEETVSDRINKAVSDFYAAAFSGYVVATYHQARIQPAGQADEPLAGDLLTSLEVQAPTPFEVVSKLAHRLLRNRSYRITTLGAE
jgi:hypothetical protein